MLPYFLLVFLPLLAWAISPRYRLTVYGKPLIETKTLPIDLFMLIFLLMLALRGLSCGMDTSQYERLYHQYGRLSLKQILQIYDHELGFKLLCKAVYVTANNYQILLGIAAAVCVCPLWYMYRRESEIQILTIVLFLTVAPFVVYFSGIRQAMAMSLGFFAWYAARDRKLCRFLLVVFTAMQFHNSAFMLFLIYPLYNAKITKKWLWFVVPCMLAVYIFRSTIFNYLITLLWKEYETTPATGATTILFLLILFSIYSYVIPNESGLDQDTIAMRNILLLSVVLQIFAMLHPLSMRMNYYFLLFIPVLIPKIAKRSRSEFSQIARLSVVVMTAYFMYYFLINAIHDNDALNVFPYIPFWEHLT